MWKSGQENSQCLQQNKVDLNKLIFKLKAKKENNEKDKQNCRICLELALE